MESVNPDPSCEDDFDPNSLPAEEATRRIDALLEPVSGHESVAIRGALGRVLSVDVTAPFDVPPYCNSARDGYALRMSDMAGGAADVSALKLVGTSLAGRPFDGTLGEGECVRIMTGAAMPQGADTVAMQEHVRVEEEQVFVPTSAPNTSHVRHPGEDLKAGTTVLQAGKLLRPADLGVLASIGLAEARVFRRLRVAFFSTGDELRSIGEQLGPGDIYDSNRYTLYGMLTRLGVEVIDLGVVRDTEDAVREAFAEASEESDVVVSTGGVSVGDADYVTAMLAEMGEVNFWKIAMKPGRPLTFGKLGPALFFGLPGNPVSVMVTFYQFVQPALRRLMGETGRVSHRVRLPLSTAIAKQPGRLEFQRGIIGIDAHGRQCVTSTGAQGSHVLNSMAHANCFIVLPLESTGARAGELVEVEPFEGVV